MSLSFPGGGRAADLARRRAVAFGEHLDDELVDRHRRWADEGRIAAWSSGDRIVAQCRLLPSAHWFGGRAVPTLNVASFAVAPEDRGQGHARRFVQALVRHGAAAGAALSLLFPATTRLYRSEGWELAGDLARFEVDARGVPAVGPSLRGADADRDGSDDDWAAIRACYERASRRQSGPAVRDEDRWARLAGATYRYVLDTPDRPGSVDAYALVDHTRTPGHWQHRLVIADWSATTPEGVRAVMALVGREGTMGRDATFHAARTSVWDLGLPEQSARQAGGLHWMARGLDLAAAVAARGFSRGVDAAVTLRVEDPLLPRWTTPWRLEVSGGRGQLVEAGNADVVADPRAVGPLYTGLLDPFELAVAGLLSGPDEALDQLRAAFAGPRPTLVDFF